MPGSTRDSIPKWSSEFAKKMEPPAASAGYASLSDQVRKLELRCDRLHELSGEILATLCVNINKEQITTADDEKFNEMITVWRKRWQEA